MTKQLLKSFIMAAAAAVALPSVAADYVKTESVTIDNTAISLNWDCGTILANNDTSTTWWDGASDVVSVTGDFQVRLTWQNTTDPNYSDVVVEFYDSSSNYWDWILGATSGWGSLMTACTSTTFSYTEDGEEATQVVPGTSDSEFQGLYELVAVRSGTTLYVQASLVRTADGFDEQVAVYTVVSTGFSTEALTFLLVGNPYFISDLTIYYPCEGTCNCEDNTGIDALSADYEVVATEYYTISGAKVDEPQKGINIVKETLSNGTVVTSKVVVK